MWNTDSRNARRAENQGTSRWTRVRLHIVKVAICGLSLVGAVACHDDAVLTVDIDAVDANHYRQRDRGHSHLERGPSVADGQMSDAVIPSDMAEIAETPDSTRDALLPPDLMEDAGATPPTQAAASCLADITNDEDPRPNYDQFDPVIGRHCSGTNHQDIDGVERVVFLGDSVTNGTPDDAHPLCVDNDHLFRSKLANWLSDRFGLSKGNLLEWEQWESYSCRYDGFAGLRRSGDFFNCARWGANNKDLLGHVDLDELGDEDRGAFCEACCAGGECGDSDRCIRASVSPELDGQCGTRGASLHECIRGGVTEERTLFVFTMGGNDVASMTKAGGEFTEETAEGRAEIEAGYPSVRAMAHEALNHLEEAVRFMKDPVRFPNGSYVVIGGPFEFTDGTGQVDSCQPQSIEIPFFGPIDLSALALDVAGLVGFERWANPRAQQHIISEFLEGYMRIIVQYQVDYVWVLEHFCGHGYVAAGQNPDVNNPCYRPEDPTLWFDVSCTHPNDAGHDALFRLFKDVIAE
jgi:hypothetical protein